MLRHMSASEIYWGPMSPMVFEDLRPGFSGITPLHLKSRGQCFSAFIVFYVYMYVNAFCDISAVERCYINTFSYLNQIQSSFLSDLSEA